MANSAKEVSASRVAIRGNTSIPGANQPLIVVDGVVMSSMDDVKQDDIAEMSVLKDAAATAIYGARGANGLVVITTKAHLQKE